jgi:fibronectin type 3 domain-containing protein
VPTVPTGLTATVVLGTQVNLTWTASTDNNAIASYRVERCQGAGCTTFTQIATPTTNSYSDTSGVANATYRYRVRAVDSTNLLSAYSSIVDAATQTPPDTQAPTVPAVLSATAQAATQITESWTASTDDVAVTAYLLERCQGAGCASFAQIASVTTTTFFDAALTSATNYSYRVRAVDAANNFSAYSNTASVSTQYAGPITYSYTYDLLRRLKQATGSDGTIIDYTYDANGNVTVISRQ